MLLSQKKFKYLNRIILENGSSIKTLSIKKNKQVELLKDNYNSTYLLHLKNKQIKDLSKEMQISLFLKKFN